MEFPIELEATTCAECGAVFGLIPNYHKTRREDGHPFHCPNGHELAYGGSENKKLKDNLERAEARLKFKNECNSRQEKTIATLKGQITKLKKK